MLKVLKNFQLNKKNTFRPYTVQLFQLLNADVNITRVIQVSIS